MIKSNKILGFFIKSYLISSSILTGTLFAESLPVIIVNAEKKTTSTEINVRKIDRTKIENSVEGNGFISSLLNSHPSIKITDSSQNSETAGEIKPGKISFHNAPFYQNNFQIDGISNDSLIDPVISSYNNPYDVPGNENEIFLDLDLIDSIRIYDSNIPVRYGNFTGGVIDAKTIRPNGKESFKVSYRYVNDSMTKIHVANKKNFDEANSDQKQPKFEKKSYSIYYATPINENNEVILSYNKIKSTIPGAYFGGFKNKTRLNESIFAKWTHYFNDDSILDLSTTYSPNKSTHFQEYIKDSDTTIKGGGYNLKVNYVKNFDTWNLNTNLGLTYSQNSKDSLNYDKKWLKSNSKPWGPMPGENETAYSKEGGSGSIKKTQKGINYNLNISRKEFTIAKISHEISTGFDINYNRSKYDRKENLYYYKKPKLHSEIYCGDNTIDCESEEQYFQNRTVYQKDNVQVGMLGTDWYIEDKMTKGIFEFTPGIRADYNNYLENLDFSYRLNGSVTPFKNNKTVIYAGFNRYYGKSFLGHKLREARLPHYDQFRDHYNAEPNPWGTSTDKDKQKYVFSDLKTPYSDEKSFGIRQDFTFMNLRANIQYIKRENKNEFSKKYGNYKVFTLPSGIDKGYYRTMTFSNKGYSNSEIVSLSLNQHKPINFGFFNMGYSFSTQLKNKNKSSGSYENILEDEKEKKTQYARYKNRTYNKEDLPQNTNPKKYALHLNLSFNEVSILGVATKININKIIRHTTPYTSIQENPSLSFFKEIPFNDLTILEEIPVYEDKKIKGITTLDLKTSLGFKVRGKHRLNLDIEVTNIFDKVSNVGTTSNSYKLGRQLWIGVSYKY